jgi:hypothetical protein
VNAEGKRLHTWGGSQLRFTPSIDYDHVTLSRKQ